MKDNYYLKLPQKNDCYNKDFAFESENFAQKMSAVLIEVYKKFGVCEAETYEEESAVI